MEKIGTSKKWMVFIVIVLMTALGFAVYGNSLNGKFIWDDHDLIRNNLFIKSWFFLPDVFAKHIGEGADVKYPSYRPFQSVSYMVDYSLWGLNVFGYHLTNILLHIFAAMALYWLINIIYGDDLLSFFTGILFLTHPVHVEAVAYISGRADALALLFMLLCFIFYIKNIGSKKKIFYVIMLLSYMLALLSRENSLILPALVLLYHYAFRKKVGLKSFLPILAIAFLYIILRLMFLKPVSPDLASHTSVFMRIPCFFVAVTKYIRLMFLPFNLHMEYGNRIFNFTDPKAILGIFMSVSLLTYGFIKRKSGNPAFFSIYWFFIALLPVSHIYPIPMAYMAEHWLYVPSIGFFLLVGHGLRLLYRSEKLNVLALACALLIIAGYSFLTIRYSACWREPTAFYERTLRYAPGSIRTIGSLANEYCSVGKTEKAIPLYEEIIIHKPDNIVGYNNLGIAYIMAGRYEDAVALYKRAIAMSPAFANAYNNLGIAYSRLGKYEDAIAVHRRAITLKPNFADAYNNIGIAYGMLGNYEEAIAMYGKAIELNPNNAKIYINLGDAYGNIGRKKEAIAAYEKAIEINPRYGPGYFNLSRFYFREKRYELAIRYCDLAAKEGYKVPSEFLELLRRIESEIARAKREG
ncbi:MAG: hypothetical protein A2Z72_05900 [Omnitrophica bacterium RBG_13_46_9]|nr:MAG: hypothetical protein A2Z72_05900 [Omnitrophica bacterium RBG_13_46_9]